MGRRADKLSGAGLGGAGRLVSRVPTDFCYRRNLLADRLDSRFSPWPSCVKLEHPAPPRYPIGPQSSIGEARSIALDEHLATWVLGRNATLLGLEFIRVYPVCTHEKRFMGGTRSFPIPVLLGSNLNTSENMVLEWLDYGLCGHTGCSVLLSTTRSNIHARRAAQRDHELTAEREVHSKQHQHPVSIAVPGLRNWKHPIRHPFERPPWILSAGRKINYVFRKTRALPMIIYHVKQKPD